MADEASGKNVVTQLDRVEVTGKRHPLDTPAVNVGADGKLGVSTPCPIPNVGPVNLNCGAGVDPKNLGIYAQITANLELPRGFRFVVAGEGSVGVTGKSSTTIVGVVSPPIGAIGGAVSVGVDTKTGKPNIGYSRSF